MGYRRGDQIGPWKLTSSLGSGGNADVWRATGSDGQTVAIKIARSVDGSSEPYRRFRIEVEALRRLAPRRGLLAILDAEIPERPTQAHPAWFSMPLATRLRDELKTATLEEIVDAIADVAGTLASLHQEGYSHRDIKPANLLWHESVPIVGDLGLVDFPDKEQLTKPGEKLGPLGFVPDEMFVSPNSSDGRAADVYSLAKTLWVLATDQRWPPQGQISRSNSRDRLGEYRLHARTEQLDRLIERATAREPDRRPAMERFEHELREWLNRTAAVGDEVNLSGIADEIRTLTEKERDLRARAGTLGRLGAETVLSALRGVTDRIAEALSLEGVQVTSVSTVGSMFEYSPPEQYHDGFRQMWADGACLSVELAGRPPMLLIGLSAMMYDDEMVRITAGAVVLSERGPARRPGDTQIVHLETAWVPAGSAEQENTVTRLERDLRLKLPEALRTLIGDQST